MTEPKAKNAVFKWLSTNGLAVMLIGSLFANAFQYQQMRESQKMSYRFQQIEEFKKTGAELDDITATYFDALADNNVTDGIKDQFNGVYRKHVTLTESDRFVLGEENTERYLNALGVLRDELNNAVGPSGAGKRIEAFAEVISTRRTLSEEALKS